jgi:glycine oxidase
VTRPDVIVIGAGVIGSSIAHALASGGRMVRVLDARAPGQGATQASAGVLAPYIEGHDSGVLCALGRRSLDLFDRFVAGVVEESGVPVFYERRGTIEVALSEGEAERLRGTRATLSKVPIEAHWLERSALAAREPGAAPTAHGGLHIPQHAYVAAEKLTIALQSAATSRGARFDSGAAVTGVAPAPNRRVHVATAAESLEADWVVLAGGSWSSRIPVAGVPELPVKPIRGQLLHLASTSPRLRHIVWGADCYLVPWPDGRVLVGATVEDVGFDERATASGVRGLLSRAVALAPTLDEAQFLEARVGLRPATPDALPIVGASAAVPGLVYATGHYRNGVLLAPLTAELVAGIIRRAEDDPALAALSPARFSGFGADARRYN